MDNYKYKDTVVLRELFEIEEAKDNIGSYYKVVISDKFDNDNKVLFPFDNTRLVEKKSIFRKKKLIEEKFRDTISANIYAQKKSDGIYEILTNRKIAKLPVMGEKYDDSVLYCFRVDELTEAKELLQMEEELEKLSKKVHIETIKSMLLATSKNVHTFCFITPMFDPNYKLIWLADKEVSEDERITPRSTTKSISEKCEKSSGAKVKKIGAYNGPYIK